MAGPAPKTQKWTARENKQGEQLVLVVGGQVEVSGTYRVPKLTEGEALRDEQSLNLELTIVDSGNAGAEVVVWMPASFQTEVTADQYHDVVVRWEGEKIAQFRVVDDSEHAELMDKQAEAQDTVAKVATRKKATPKKAAKKAAKKTATKKAAKKVVKKAAKKPAKKAAKKTAKKATKKAAKKKAAKKAPKKKKR